MHIRLLAIATLLSALPVLAPAEFQLTSGGEVATETGARSTSPVQVKYSHQPRQRPRGTRALNLSPSQLTGPENLDLALMANGVGAPLDLSLESFLLATPFWDGTAPWTLRAIDQRGAGLNLAKDAVELRPARIGSIQALQVLVDSDLMEGDATLELTPPSPRSPASRFVPISEFPDVARMASELFINGAQLTQVPVGSSTPRGGVAPPAVPGTLRAWHTGGDEILSIPLADLGITAGEIANLGTDHHGTNIGIGGVIGGTDLWLYAPKFETTENRTDSIFLTPSASSPSQVMNSRAAFSTLTPGGTEVAQDRTREYEWNLRYERGSINPLGERFVFHRVLSGGTESYQLPVFDHLTETTVTMQVEAHGFNFSGNYPDHYAEFALETYNSPQAIWDGRVPFNGSYDAPVPLPNGPMLSFSHGIPAGSPFSGGIDIQNLEKINLSWRGYPRVDSSTLSATVDIASDISPRRVTIGGFPGGTTAGDILLLDIAQLDPPTIITGAVPFTDADGTVAFEFEVSSVAAKIYVQHVSTINSVSAVVPSRSLPLPPAGEMLAGVYVADPIFQDELAPLSTRRGDGIVQLDPQAAYDTFSGGQQSRDAIVQAVQWLLANAPSRVPLPQLLLVGHGSLDPKDYLGTQTGAQIHPYVEDSALSGGIAIENPVDFQYGLTEGSDGFEDVYYSRIPARTEAEVAEAVTKILLFDDISETLRGLDRPGIFVTDNEAGFHADIPEIVSIWSETGHPSEEITIPLSGADVVAIRADIYSALQDDDGAAFMMYTGHGNVDRWASENIFNNTDVPSVDTTNKWPIISTFTCLNGYYAFPGASTPSLGEELLFTNMGAAAVIAPCSVDYYFEQKSFAEEILSLLGNSSRGGGLPTTVGELLTRARNNYLVKYPAFHRTAHEYLMFAEPQTPIPLQSLTNVPIEMWLVN